MTRNAQPATAEEIVQILGPSPSSTRNAVCGAKRAESFRRARAAALHDEPTAAFVDKRRSGGIVSGELLVGEVQDRAAILFDDLISTGTTLQRAALRCREAGALHRLLRSIPERIGGSADSR
jgi:phosphoribosylpyrophosphate synthetase